jgi:hypothetical protein
MGIKLRNRVFLIILLLITWLDLSRFGSMPVSKIGRAIPVFPQLQIDLLRAKEQNLVNDALRETSRTLLQYLVPEHYREPWEAQFLFVDLLGDREPEVVFSFALPPEQGILVLLQKEGQNYYLVSYRTDLLPINKLEKLPLESGLPVFVTREDHQERLGAFCDSAVITLWKWHDNRLREVFTENTNWEINWLNTWQDPKSTPPQWLKLRQAFQITCQEKEGQILLLVEGEQEFSAAPARQALTDQITGLPAEYEFSLLQNRPISRQYSWDEEWQHFILRTGSYLPPNEDTPQKIAILKDLNDSLETLANPNTATNTTDAGYLVQDRKERTFTLPKNQVLN